jgi:taurine dioxygenase/putative 2-oxoglutarate oxygenase
MPWNEALERSPGTMPWNDELLGRRGGKDASDVAPNRKNPAVLGSPLLQFRRLSAEIGIEASGIDLSEPISSQTFDRIHAAWLETGLLIFRRQSLSADRQIAFTKRFGKILVYTRSENAHPDYPELLILSNLRRNGRPCGSPASGRYWHTDGHFLRRPPSASLLHAIHVPRTGGDTWFASMTAAYDALPPDLQSRLAGLRVIISRVRSRPYNYPEKPPVTDAERAAWPDMDQPIVRTHPETGRRALYVGGNVPWRVENMPEAESTPLITELQAHAIQPQFIHVHKWRRGDLVIWDNRSVLHRATAYDQQRSKRHMHRTSVAGDIPR